MLRPLLAGRIVMTPKDTAEGRFYDFEAPLSSGALLHGLLGLAGPGVVTVGPRSGPPMF